jgi:hypothetical protein
MAEILVYNKLSELDTLADSWDRLSALEQRYFPNFSETKHVLEVTKSEFRIVVALDNLVTIGIACFMYGNAMMRFSIGERRLFSLPVKEVTILGASVLGEVNSDTIEEFLTIIVNEWDFDLIRSGEIIVNSPLHAAITHLKGVKRFGRRDSVRWLIRLPESFDSYLKSLRSSTRKSITQQLRTFERKMPFEFHVIDRPEQVDTFLRDGERISRMTYQWNVGQRLCNDGSTREGYVRLARAGNLRCYIIYVEGRPCTFARGELSGRFYNYETPGFDPQYHKLSPGVVLLMWIIRDLIENTDCEVFDFGTGGDNKGYKSRFGTISIDSTTILLAKWHKPYSMFLFALQNTFSLARDLFSFIVGHGWLRQRLKKAIRQYGDDAAA